MASGHANFVHLRVHSAFSLLEGAMQPDEIAKLCKANRMPAVAVTDTNNLFGLYDITDALVKAGVQPIVGCQLVLQLESADPRRSGTAQAGPSGTIALLVQSEAGYANLMKLASKAYLDVKPGDTPHITWAALEQYSQDLILLSGGPKGLLNKLVVAGQTDAARDLVQRFVRVFGDRFYIELQRHGMADEIAAEPQLAALAYEYKVPLVASNEPFFAKPDMFPAHDALLCIAAGSFVLEDNRRRETAEHYFKSADEMAELFADVPEAIENTIEIAKRCAFIPKKRSCRNTSRRRAFRRKRNCGRKRRRA
jgi:DNA polymerase-3 subunit alpha